MAQIKKDSQCFSVLCCVVKPFCIRSASSSRTHFVFTHPWSHGINLHDHTAIHCLTGGRGCGSLSVAGKRVLYKNSNDKYEKHPYVMQFIYIAYVYVSLMTAACKT